MFFFEKSTATHNDYPKRLLSLEALEQDIEATVGAPLHTLKNYLTPVVSRVTLLRDEIKANRSLLSRLCAWLLHRPLWQHLLLASCCILLSACIGLLIHMAWPTACVGLVVYGLFYSAAKKQHELTLRQEEKLYNDNLSIAASLTESMLVINGLESSLQNVLIDMNNQNQALINSQRTFQAEIDRLTRQNNELSVTVDGLKTIHEQMEGHQDAMCQAVRRLQSIPHDIGAQSDLLATICDSFKTLTATMTKSALQFQTFSQSYTPFLSTLQQLSHVIDGTNEDFKPSSDMMSSFQDSIQQTEKAIAKADDALEEIRLVRSLRDMKAVRY